MKRLSRFVLTLFLIGLPGIASTGKAPPCVKDGVKYGVVRGNFREEWYSYQERGESYLAGECYESALKDFERAIELRTAVDRAAKIPGCDTRRARTYGMHFVDWFGHRDRGVALYHLGRIDEAIQELEFSLQCTESAMAQFYLDKARAEKLRQTGGDTRAPAIKAVHLVAREPRIDYVMNKEEAKIPGYDRRVAVPYYFTLDEIESILEGLSRKERKQLKLEPGWGYQVISWKSEDEIEGSAVNQGEIYAVVETEDDQGVKTVEVSGVKSPYTFAQKTRADMIPLTIIPPAEPKTLSADSLEPENLFALPLDEARGRVSLELVVTDLLGKSSRTTLSLLIDTSGPQISLEEVKRLPDGSLRIRGRWQDASGIRRFEVGGQVPQRKGGDGFEVILPPAAGERVSFKVVDKLGNDTTGVLVLSPRAKGAWGFPFPRWAKLVRKLYQFAALDSFDFPSFPPMPAYTAEDPWSPTSRTIPLPGFGPGPGPLEVALDLELYWSEMQNMLGMSPQPPQITLKTRPQTVYSNQIYVEGAVAGRGGMVTSITIDGKPVLRSPRTNAFFSKLVYLRPGKNAIMIEAKDENGLKSTETLFVRRVVPRVRTVAERLAVSMLPFYLDPSYQDISEVAYDNLATSLITQRRFRYVDRGKVEAAVREMKLAGSGLVEPGTAVRAGKLSNAEAIIIGVVRETPSTIEIKAQVVDVESSRIMVTKDAFDQDKSLSNLKFITQGLAAKIQNAFPVVQGNIKETQGDKAVITLGRRNRLLPGMKVVFFQLVPKKDQAGNPIGMDTRKLGEGSVLAISSSLSTVALTRSEGVPGPQDLVITK